MSRDPLLFLDDIQSSCAKLLRFTEGRERDEVFADEMRFDALLYNLQVLGEAVKKLPPDLRERHPDIAWREIAGMRDVVAHAYFALDLDILWSAIRHDVPRLAERITEILAQEKTTGPLSGKSVD